MPFSFDLVIECCSHYLHWAAWRMATGAKCWSKTFLHNTDV